MRTRLQAGLDILAQDHSNAVALREVLIALRPFALTYATRLLGGRIDEAEDITQDVFLRVASRLVGASQPSLYAASELRSFVIRSVANAAIDLQRAEARAFQRRQRWASELKAAPEQDFDHSRLSELRDAIAELSESDRSFLGLVLEGHPIKAVAQRLGITYGAATVRMHRIRLRIAKIMSNKQLALQSTP